jgi:hypothetical protein
MKHFFGAFWAESGGPYETVDIICDESALERFAWDDG